MVNLAEVVDGREYRPVDALPEIAQARQQVRNDAWATVRAREEQLFEGKIGQVPLAIDALSTADEVLLAKDAYGKGSQEYLDRLAGLELDCLRLVAEWYRKKRPEYFPKTEHFFDAQTGDFYSHGLSIRQMTENALRPIGNNPEEVHRRVNERVENETALLLKKVGGFVLGQVGIRTISECTDTAIEDYKNDQKAGLPHRGYDGYVPEIEKVMIRDMRIDEVTGNRTEEQLGLPGLYINHYVIQEALRRRGVETADMDKTQLHGNQLLVNDDLMDFVALLDEVASEEWCTNIYLGEEVPEDHQKNYIDFRQEAQERQNGLKEMASKTAMFVIDLAEDGFDRRKAPAHIEEFVKTMLLNMAKQDVKLAVQMFDEKTAAGLQEVAYLEAMGRNQEASELLREVEKNAPGGGYCSGGSCGLESVDKFSKLGKELSEKLKAESGDEIVKDKERRCRCGNRSIVYAYNKNKVNKFCESCHAFESKQVSRGNKA